MSGDDASAEDQLLADGRNAYRLGDLTAAAASFQRLVNSPHRRADALYGLGMVALSRQRTDEAAQLFQATVGADPGYVNALYQLGTIAERTSTTRAERLYEEVVRRSPEHAGALKQLHHLEQARAGQPTSPPKKALTISEVPGTVSGQVAGLQRRTEGKQSVLAFRLEREDRPTLTVEMRGRRVEGYITNGDLVRIRDHGIEPGRVVKVSHLENVTISAEVSSS